MVLLGFCLSITLFAQTKITVVGTVTDSTNAPLQGITLTVQGNEKSGTTSDVNGRFVLDVPVGSTIIFSSVTYNNYLYQVPASVPANLKIILTLKKISSEDEVIITAYGEKKLRESVTGSVTTVKPENLRIPSSNLTAALGGQIAGIIAYQPNGQPGYDNAQFFIRGVTTFGYSSSPLILIDNLESSSTDLARLQVDDIESFSLLKDASATALYGSRGANGVILVSTKRGKQGTPTVSVRVENSTASPTKNLDIADPITFMNMYNEASVTRDPYAGAYYTADKIYFTQQTMNKAPGYNPYVFPANDWKNLLFKKYTNNQRANLNINGGGNLARYFVSGSYSLDNGILKVDPMNNFNNNVKLQSYQLRSNIDIDLTKTTLLSALIGGLFDQYNGPITSDPSGSSDLWNIMMHTDPVAFPAYFLPDAANQYTQHILFGNTTGGLSTNPYANLMKGYYQYFRSTINAQLNLSQDLRMLLKGLKFSGMISTTRFANYNITRNYNPYYYAVQNYDIVANTYTLQWLNSTPGDATEYLGYSRSANTVTSKVYMQGVLSYDNTFGKNTVSSKLIGSRQERIDGTAGDGSLQGTLPFRNLNFSGSLSYTYDKKYITDFSFGYNGSERFSANNRFGFFPTVSAAWVVSREKFWKEFFLGNIFTSFKLRGSYGSVGNDNISATRFFYLSNVNLSGGSGASFGVGNGYSRSGVTILNYPNPMVTWERSTQTNLATEFTVLNDLKIVAEVYKQKRKNIYQSRLPISSMGLEASIGANIGKAESKGLDLSMDYSKQLNKDVLISGRGNLTFTQSKYLYYEEPDYPGEPWRRKTGSLIGQQSGYIAERLFVDDEEVANSPTQFAGTKGGDIKYRDVNGDGQITTADMVPIGNPTTPQITYGFGLSSRIKQFDIAFFFQGNGKTSFFINASSVSPFLGNASQSASKTLLLQAFANDHWSESNRDLYALYPRFGTSSNQITNNLQPSTWWMRNGAFLRLKSVELGYSLSPRMLSKIRIKSFRLYASGMNLYTFSKFKLWDVEQGGKGFAYPIQKTLNIGAQISIN
jgi:TonB-linked SusC/RagA family outer membrane protein